MYIIMKAEINSSHNEPKNDSSDKISDTAVAAQNESVISRKVESKRHERKYSFIWSIHDFSCLHTRPHDSLPSTKFEFDFGTKMSFNGSLSINGKYCEDRYCTLKLENLYDVTWSLHCKISTNGIETSLDFDQTEEIQDFDFFHKAQQDDVDKITLDISLVDYKEVEEVPELVIPKKLLRADMKRLFESKIMADIEFVVQDEIIVAHKLILATRSKFFAAMFKQKQMGDSPCVQEIINDIEPKVFNEILCYIYTDNVSDISKMPKQLLIASNKFILGDLKRMCEMELARQMNVENVSELLIIADENGAKYLRDIAINFIKLHCSRVRNTPGFQKIMKDKLHLLAELFNLIVE